MGADPQLTEALRLWSYGVGHVADLRVREGVRALFVEAGRLRAALIRHEMKARGAYYTDDSFYGLVGFVADSRSAPTSRNMRRF